MEQVMISCSMNAILYNIIILYNIYMNSNIFMKLHSRRKIGVLPISSTAMQRKPEHHLLI